MRGAFRFWGFLQPLWGLAGSVPVRRRCGAAVPATAPPPRPHQDGGAVVAARPARALRGRAVPVAALRPFGPRWARPPGRDRAAGVGEGAGALPGASGGGGCPERQRPLPAARAERGSGCGGGGDRAEDALPLPWPGAKRVFRAWLHFVLPALRGCGWGARCLGKTRARPRSPARVQLYYTAPFVPALSRERVTQNVLGLLGTVTVGGATALSPSPSRARWLLRGLGTDWLIPSPQPAAPAESSACTNTAVPAERYSILPSENYLHCFIKWYCSVANTV